MAPFSAAAEDSCCSTMVSAVDLAFCRQCVQHTLMGECCVPALIEVAAVHDSAGATLSAV